MKIFMIHVQLIGFERPAIIMDILALRSRTQPIYFKPWCLDDEAVVPQPDVALVEAGRADWRLVIYRVNKSRAPHNFLMGDACPSIGVPVLPPYFKLKDLLAQLPHHLRRKDQRARWLFPPTMPLLPADMRT